MLRRAERFIDKMPFAGKYTLEPALKGYTRSQPGHERLKFAGTCVLLGGFVLAHANEARFGINTFTEQLQNFEHAPDVNDLQNLAIDVTYTAAMAAVSLRQVGLLRAANRIRKHRHTRNERRQTQIQEPEIPTLDLRLSDEMPNAVQGVENTEASGSKKPRSPFTKQRLGAMGLAFLVTAGGQAAMMESAHTAATEHFREACIPEAAHDIITQEQADGATISGLESLRKEWIDYCGVSPSDITPIFPHPQTTVTITQQGW